MKWSNLLRTYRAQKDISSKSGRGRIRRFLFFNKLDELFGHKISNQSTGVGIGISCATVIESTDDGKENVSDSETASTVSAAVDSTKKRENARSVYYKAKAQFYKEENERRSEELKWREIFRLNREEREERKLKLLENVLN